MVGEHYYYFGQKHLEKKMDERLWIELRIDDEDTPFSIEKSVEKYEENCRKAISYRETAELICNKIGNNKYIGSLGIGKGILEWHIKDINSTCKIDGFDYSQETLTVLRKVCTKIDTFEKFDMLADNYDRLVQYDYIIMYRLSTEFNSEQWRKIFCDMYEANVKKVIYIPTELATVELINEEEQRHREIVKKQWHDTFCGWLYSEEEYPKMWNDKYEISLAVDYEKTKIFFLTRLA